MDTQASEAILNRAIKVFGDEQRANTWLQKPCLALGDLRPAELLQSTRGKKMVLAELGRIGHFIIS